MMLASTVDYVNLEIGQAAVLALLGYAVVFFGLILLMGVIIIMGKIFIAKDKASAAKAASAKASVTAAPVAVTAVPSEPVVAPGSAGQLKLYDVEPKTAAMLMAIVANKMGKPLNELRFISIKEVK